jgi:hypothetical protein
MERHKMKITERTYDIATGEITDVERELTAKEIAKAKTSAAEAAARQAEAEAKEATRQAVLTKLGLTAEEAAALLA